VGARTSGHHCQTKMQPRTETQQPVQTNQKKASNQPLQ
jgi:hypothetical protein